MIRLFQSTNAIRAGMVVLLSTALELLAGKPAQAAALQQVGNWNGGMTFPSDVSMYVYVPANVGTNAPILALLHYCGGTAAGVFGQAQGGGIVAAADQYGFIMVVPSCGRCWDVKSDKAWTRDGGGDSHAIKQMVTYTVSQYQANPGRVYATGDSIGGMMTELLLALYPDVFKGGSSFAGVPAACRGPSESGATAGYSSACANGTVSHTAQEWGDIVRNMDPAYLGRRPRLQLFRGDADPTVRYANLVESIKQYTNLLSLPTDAPIETGITLGTHQATRQKWKDSCGYLVLDALRSIGGDHGPSDALFLSQYVIPFLGLDVPGAVDPGVAACTADAGAGGMGGSPGTGGELGTGGIVGTGGTVGSGGVVGTGGIGRGGAVGTGGLPGSGGILGGGGVTGTGGRADGDAAQGNGGAVATGGAPYVADAADVSMTGGAPGPDGSVFVADVSDGAGESGSVEVADPGADAPFFANDAPSLDANARLDLGSKGYDGPPADTASPDVSMASADAGADTTPARAGRHELYGLPSCAFAPGPRCHAGVMIVFALLLLRRRQRLSNR